MKNYLFGLSKLVSERYKTFIRILKFSNRKNMLILKFLVDQLQDDKFIEYYKDIYINDIYI